VPWSEGDDDHDDKFQTPMAEINSLNNVKETEGKRIFGRARCKRKDNNKMNLKATRGECVDFIQLV